MAFTETNRLSFLSLILGTACALLVACGSSDVDIEAATPAVARKTCAELEGMAIPASSIGMPTSGASVIGCAIIAASGTGAAAIVEHCRVTGEIKPVDSKAPAIRFQVSLPVAWNRNAMMFGGGGYDGVLPEGAQNVPAGPLDMPVPLSRGYATFSSDSGHQANALNVLDGSFGVNDEALANFAADAIKKTRDTAMSIIRVHYGAMPARTYFAGGSSGGREGLIAVSNWPQDFDGLITMYPAWNAVALNLQFGRITRALAQPGAYPNTQKRKLLHDAGIAVCDAFDGVRDGLVSNVDACNSTFDPATVVVDGVALRCPGGADTADTCLSDAQIAAFKAVGTPLRLNYTLASGETGYPGFNAWGTNFGMAGNGPLNAAIISLAFGTEQPRAPISAIGPGNPPFHSAFWDQWIRFFVTRDAGFDTLAVDPTNPGRLQSRIVQLNGLQDANKVDLSAFQARGGKILMAHGTADALVSSQATRQYMERLYHAMGRETVANFVRYYEIPGYAHVASTDFNASWDSLTVLENWTQKNIPPSNPIVADTAGVAGRTRPLCDYPSWPRYKGLGDINAAASFVCTTR